MNGTNNSAKHYDLVVIGSGAAGHHGAIQAAKLGKKVAVVERSVALGGASINTGTIPSKTLREAVLRSTRSGCTDRRISASNLAQRIEEVASNEVRVFESQFRRNDIDVLRHCFLSGPHTSGLRIRKKSTLPRGPVLIVAGSRPPTTMRFPWTMSRLSMQTQFAGYERSTVLTIVGVAIGVEHACIAAALIFR